MILAGILSALAGFKADMAFIASLEDDPIAQERRRLETEPAQRIEVVLPPAPDAMAHIADSAADVVVPIRQRAWSYAEEKWRWQIDQRVKDDEARERADDRFSAWMELCRQRYEIYRRQHEHLELGASEPTSAQFARWAKHITAKVKRCCPIAEDPEDAGLHPDWCPCPGEHILEILEHKKMTYADLAHALEVELIVVSGLVDGLLAIDETMANRLSEAFGRMSASFWLRLQEHYDYWCVTHGRPVTSRARAAGLW